MFGRSVISVVDTFHQPKTVCMKCAKTDQTARLRSLTSFCAFHICIKVAVLLFSSHSVFTLNIGTPELPNIFVLNRKKSILLSFAVVFF